jgi:SAM-dependent methyltransferase
MTHIPFSNDSYDLVVSCHAMEHIPHSLRQVALAEMVRVARRWVVVSCPTGPDAQQADIELAERFARGKRVIPPWLDEHLRFGLPDLSALSEPYNCRGELTHSMSVELNNAMARLESRRLLQILSGIAARVVPQVAGSLLSRMFSGERYYDAVFVIAKNNSC